MAAPLDRLREAQKIPAPVAAFMRTILILRNIVEHDEVNLTKSQERAAESMWAAITERASEALMRMTAKGCRESMVVHASSGQPETLCTAGGCGAHPRDDFRQRPSPYLAEMWIEVDVSNLTFRVLPTRRCWKYSRSAFLP